MAALLPPLQMLPPPHNTDKQDVSDGWWQSGSKNHKMLTRACNTPLVKTTGVAQVNRMEMTLHDAKRGV
jgi:hypothetical protein